MNKKLVLLLLVVLLVYYLNSEEPKSRKSLLSEPWITPSSPKKEVSPESKSTTSVPESKKEPLIQPNQEPIKNEVSERQQTDYSWLTDDNLEYILKNWEPIKEALKANQTQKKFTLRTDLANIYNCFYKARTSQDWDLPEFLERLEDNKHQYTLFPLRVNGNHWGLFVLAEEEEMEPEETMEPGTIYFPSFRSVRLVTKVYYTSSGGGDLETEKQQLQPFINQIVGAGTPITIIQPKDRNSKGYECGVYLCFYVREMLETGKLELKRSYTESKCQEFRKEWKERIGESWGRW